MSAIGACDQLIHGNAIRHRAQGDFPDPQLGLRSFGQRRAASFHRYKTQHQDYQEVARRLRGTIPREQ